MRKRIGEISMVKVLITIGVMILVALFMFCLLVAAIAGGEKVDKKSAGKWYWPLKICKAIGNIEAWAIAIAISFAITYGLIWRY